MISTGVAGVRALNELDRVDAILPPLVAFAGAASRMISAVGAAHGASTTAHHRCAASPEISFSGSPFRRLGRGSATIAHAGQVSALARFVEAKPMTSEEDGATAIHIA
jgi:hypothetical protein